MVSGTARLSYVPDLTTHSIEHAITSLAIASSNRPKAANICPQLHLRGSGPSHLPGSRWVLSTPANLPVRRGIASTANRHACGGGSFFFMEIARTLSLRGGATKKLMP